jgi:hypothetical protein
MLIEQLHNSVWMVFWLSIVLHLFLGFFIPLMREFFKALKQSLNQNFKDHEDIARIILRKDKQQ